MSSDFELAIPEHCTPAAAADDPDDDFADSNCDGIDGDATKAVFVSGGPVWGNAGTPSAPLKTLAEGIQLAQSSQKDVYVCNGTYAENIVIQNTGVRVFGGYDCAHHWTRTADRAQVAPSSGRPLKIAGAGGTMIDRLGFKASSGAEAGESSIAGIIQNSPDVIVRNALFEAGNGADGKSGAVPAAVTTPAPKGVDGFSGNTCPLGTSSDPCTKVSQPGGTQYLVTTCPGLPLQFKGGAGGPGGTVNVGWLNGLQGSPWGAAGGVHTTVTSNDVGVPAAGSDGANGQPGAAGGPADLSIGTLQNGDYVASNAGKPGDTGKPGQSAGGGSGGWGGKVWDDDVTYHYISGCSGGQGGYPGCGGAAGQGGGGGGASIALVIIGSSVQLSHTLLRTGNGGAGGNPSLGADGQPGGAPGLAGCQGYPIDGASERGGTGGSGGKGGAGGPGGGGPSVGVLVQGTPPVTEGATFDLGLGGKGGKAVADTQDGASGVQKDLYVL